MNKTIKYFIFSLVILLIIISIYGLIPTKYDFNEHLTIEGLDGTYNESCFAEGKCIGMISRGGQIVWTNKCVIVNQACKIDGQYCLYEDPRKTCPNDSIICTIEHCKNEVDDE